MKPRRGDRMGRVLNLIENGCGHIAAVVSSGLTGAAARAWTLAPYIQQHARLESTAWPPLFSVATCARPTMTARLKLSAG